MEYIKIKDLDIYISDGNYSSKYPNSNEFIKHGIPFIRCNNFDNNSITDKDMYYISETKHSELLKGHLKTNDVLISTRGNIGQVVIVPERYNDANINAQIVLLRAGLTLDSKYLMWTLKSKYVQMQMKQNQTGSALKQLPVKRLREIKVPIANNIKKQKSIANKLDNLFELINLKKRQLLECDKLIESQFIDMFGNIKETIRLGDCCNVHARIGWQALSRKEHMKTGDYLLVTGTDFKNNEIDYSTCVYVSKERYEMDKHIILKNDDILITKDGTIGKVAIVQDLPKPATLNGGVFVVRPDDRFNKEYIAYVFKGPLFTDFVSKSKTGATIKHLNQKHLVEFNIPLPEMQDQIRFSNLYKKIEKQKSKFEDSLNKLEELQSALMQEYFG